MNPKESTETRLLRTITALIEAITHDTAVAMADADPHLRGWTGTLARLAGAELRRHIMSGKLDLMKATEDELEVEVAAAVALAASKISRSRLMASGGEPPPPAPANCPCKS